MNFIEATLHRKAGQCIRRTCWPKDQWVVDDCGRPNVVNYITNTNYYTFDDVEVLADDWELRKEPLSLQAVIDVIDAELVRQHEDNHGYTECVLLHLKHALEEQFA